MLRNIRQFLNGMKNYLVGVSPESDLINKEIKKQSGKLGPCEFLNVDLILEEILVDLVIQPLYSHIMSLLRSENQKSAANIHASNDRSASSKFSRIYESFEESISPITKLEKWNEFVCEVTFQSFTKAIKILTNNKFEFYFESTQVKVLTDESHSPEFFAHLTCCLRAVCSGDVESHSDFVVGLLPPCISERNGYSLSLLQSAVSALKASSTSGNNIGSVICEGGNATTPGSEVPRPQQRLTSVKVLVPDERSGTLIRYFLTDFLIVKQVLGCLFLF